MVIDGQFRIAQNLKHLPTQAGLIAAPIGSLLTEAQRSVPDSHLGESNAQALQQRCSAAVDALETADEGHIEGLPLVSREDKTFGSNPRRFNSARIPLCRKNSRVAGTKR